MELEDRMPRRLGPPLLVRRVERDVEEGARHPAEREVAPQHRDRVGWIELLDAVALLWRPRRSSTVSRRARS